MDARLIAWPAVAMALLTFVVAVRMFQVRIAQIKRERIRLQTIATSSQAAQKLTESGPADNYRNLFELPVLFYAALALCAQMGFVSTLTLALAWIFVVLRVAHSWIQCTYNRVKHRFYAFVGGFFVLVALWIVIAVDLLR
ncbi:MAG TPA: MAPEG family protein [Rudaea sp.]